MYVAITRARKRLYLSFSQTRMLHGQTRYNLKSRFIDELPEPTLKWLTPRTGLVGGGFDGRRGGWGGSGGWGGREAGYAAGSPSYAGGAVGGAVRSADARLAARFDRGLSWRIGQSVAHSRFGEGVIINIEGSGTDARVQVNFGREGVKWLALSVAKLEAVR